MNGKVKTILLESTRLEKNEELKTQIRSEGWLTGTGYDNSYQVYSDETGNTVELEMIPDFFLRREIVIVRVSEDQDGRHYVEINKVNIRVKMVDTVELIRCNYMFAVIEDVEEYI